MADERQGAAAHVGGLTSPYALQCPNFKLHRSHLHISMPNHTTIPSALAEVNRSVMAGISIQGGFLAPSAAGKPLRTLSCLAYGMRRLLLEATAPWVPPFFFCFRIDPHQRRTAVVSSGGGLPVRMTNTTHPGVTSHASGTASALFLTQILRKSYGNILK